MALPTVSIIIPFINEYDLLQESLASAMKQDTPIAEIIVVCNQATPPDPSRLKGLPPTARLLHQPEPGSAMARNTGLLASSGEWIQFLDVDDLLMPGKIRHQLEAVSGDIIVSPHVFKWIYGKRRRSKWLPDDIWVGLLNSGLGSTSSMLWRRSSLMEVNGWNTALQSHQEYDLLFRLLKAGQHIQPFDRTETIVRQRSSGSITHTSKPVRNEEGLQLREAIWQYLQDHSITSPVREEAFLQYAFRQLRGLFRKNRSLAEEKYNHYYSGKKFKPYDVGVPGYQVLFSLLGFKRTEWLIQLLLRVVRVGKSS